MEQGASYLKKYQIVNRKENMKFSKLRICKPSTTNAPLAKLDVYQNEIINLLYVKNQDCLFIIIKKTKIRDKQQEQRNLFGYSLYYMSFSKTPKQARFRKIANLDKTTRPRLSLPIKTTLDGSFLVVKKSKAKLQMYSICDLKKISKFSFVDVEKDLIINSKTSFTLMDFDEIKNQIEKESKEGGDKRVEIVDFELLNNDRMLIGTTCSVLLYSFKESRFRALDASVNSKMKLLSKLPLSPKIESLSRIKFCPKNQRSFLYFKDEGLSITSKISILLINRQNKLAKKVMKNCRNCEILDFQIFDFNGILHILTFGEKDQDCLIEVFRYAKCSVQKVNRIVLSKVGKVVQTSLINFYTLSILFHNLKVKSFNVKDLIKL